jgi:hypothetical protein
VRRTGIDGFPLAVKESAETSQGLAHIHQISSPSPVACFPKCGGRHAPCQTDSGHHPEPQRTSKKLDLVRKNKLTAAIIGRHPDICEDLIHAQLDVEI